MKQVLLTKHHDVTAFASSDKSRYVLNSVHYRAGDKCVEACDGRVLIRVPVTQSEGEFPPVKTALPEEPVDTIIPVSAVKRAMANIPKAGNLPILEYAKLDANGMVTLTTTDLDTEQAITAKPVEGTYPKTDQVIPDYVPTLTIAIAANVLARVAEYAQKHAVDPERVVRLEFKDSLSPVRFSLTLEDLSGHVKATGVMMPVRLS